MFSSAIHAAHKKDKWDNRVSLEFEKFAENVLEMIKKNCNCDVVSFNLKFVWHFKAFTLFLKGLLKEMCSPRPHIYASFGSFCIEIGQFIEAQ